MAQQTSTGCPPAPSLPRAALEQPPPAATLHVCTCRAAPCRPRRNSAAALASHAPRRPRRAQQSPRGCPGSRGCPPRATGAAVASALRRGCRKREHPPRRASAFPAATGRMPPTGVGGTKCQEKIQMPQHTLQHMAYRRPPSGNPLAPHTSSCARAAKAAGPALRRAHHPRRRRRWHPLLPRSAHCRSPEGAATAVTVPVACRRG